MDEVAVVADHFADILRRFGDPSKLMGDIDLILERPFLQLQGLAGLRVRRLCRGAENRRLIRKLVNLREKKTLQQTAHHHGGGERRA
jgi:hypothetical protein